MAITSNHVKDLRGTPVHDRHDDFVGTLDEVYVDNASGAPRWITVDTGVVRESFVPLDGARADGDALRVAVDRSAVEDAPRSGQRPGELSESEERRLHSHYGVPPRSTGT